MVRVTFFVGIALALAGCASILGNDYEVEGAGGVAGVTGAVTTGGSGGGAGRTGSTTGGGAGASGSSAGSGASGASGSGGAAGAAGAGGSATGGAAGSGGSSTGGAAGTGGSSGASGAGGSSGAGPDASSSGGAAGSQVDAGPDAPADTSMGTDAPAETSSPDTGGGMDAPPDVPPSCNPVNGSCGGGLLTCNPGFASCNGSNSDGCECSTPACCGASCQTTHVACMLNGNPNSPCTDGTGQHFHDCVALGTINSAQATKACAAVTGNVSACSPGSCPGSHLVVCSFDGGGNCICWEHSGTQAGRIYKSLNASCYCPTSTSPTWN